MNGPVSLTFKVVSIIHDHHANPAKGRGARFCQQQLLDRILAISISILAIADVGTHVTISLYKCSEALYKALIHREPLSFQQAVRHLRIASLFCSVVVFGSLTCFIYPPFADEIFENSQMRFVRNLLLSGKPGAFKDSSNAGGMFGLETLKEFCPVIKDLPIEIQRSMEPTLSLVKEAQAFEKTIERYDDLVALATFDSFYAKITKGFNELNAVKGTPLRQFMVRQVASRVNLLALAILSIPIVIATAVYSYMMLSALCIVKILSQNDLFNVTIKKIFYLAILNIASMARCLVAIPFCLTVGLYNPFKAQSLFFSPMFKGDEAYRSEAISSWSNKVKALPEGASSLLSLSTFIEESEGVLSGRHAYCILVTRLRENYRISIINRGWGSNPVHSDRGGNKRDVDFSVDNVDADFLKNYISFLVRFQERSFASKIFENSKEKGDLILTVLMLLYSLPAGKRALNKIIEPVDVEEPIIKTKVYRFESRHHKSSQKIGNCTVSSLLGAISLHSAMQTKNLQDKRTYKKFIASYKKTVMEKYGYLMDFDLTLRPNARAMV